jgi:hypothetical protein
MHSKRIQPALLAGLSFFLILTAVDALPTSPANPVPTAIPILPPPTTPAPQESIPVVINYGQGQEARVSIYRGLMEPVGLLPRQAVTVTLFFPANLAGTPVAIGLYDGGQVGAVAQPRTQIVAVNAILTAAANGTVQFNFQTDHTPGLYRVLLSVGGGQYLLQFYAVTSASDLVPHPHPPPTPLPSPTPQ